ncbi:hypothetical protein K438DRAFT_2101039 [Mycena galopus ATCC 62051]|nr:hypothetical protein K438DRAFT_2101039 [Mycena galopus ATCC 62051]
MNAARPRMHSESIQEIMRTHIKPASPLHAGRGAAAKGGLMLQRGPLPLVAVAVSTAPAWRIWLHEVKIVRGSRDATHRCGRFRISGFQDGSVGRTLTSEADAVTHTLTGPRYIPLARLQATSNQEEYNGGDVGCGLCMEGCIVKDDHVTDVGCEDTILTDGHGGTRGRRVRGWASERAERKATCGEELQCLKAAATFNKGVWNFVTSTNEMGVNDNLIIVEAGNEWPVHIAIVVLMAVEESWRRAQGPRQEYMSGRGVGTCGAGFHWSPINLGD